MSTAEIVSKRALSSATRRARRTNAVFLTPERLGLPINRYLPTIQTCSQPHLTYPTLATTFP